MAPEMEAQIPKLINQKATPEITKFMRELRLILNGYARLSIALALAAFTIAQAAAQPLVLDKRSPFFIDLLERPVPNDTVELMTIAFVYEHAGHGGEAGRLHELAERRTLKRMLNEAADEPKTIAEAFAAHAAVSAAESIVELRKRVLRVFASVERARSKGGEVEHSGRIEYLGNSIWQGGVANRRVWVRMTLTNRSGRAIHGLALGAGEWLREHLYFQCRLDEPAPIPAGERRTVVCQDDTDAEKPGALIRALAAAPGEPIRVTYLEFDGFSLSEDSNHLSNGKAYRAALVRAAELLAATPCAQLNACAQLAKREAEDAKREAERYAQSRAGWEADMESRRVWAEDAKLFGFIALATLTFGFACAGRRWAPESRGWVPSVLAGLTVLIGSVAIWGAIAVLEALGMGWGAVAGYVIGEAALLLILLFLGLLGVAMHDRDRRTVLRMGAVGFGLGSIVFVLAAFFRTG